MEDEKEEILNFNQILFQPSQEIIRAPSNPPRTPPRKQNPQSNHSAKKSTQAEKEKKQSSPNSNSNTQNLSRTVGSNQIRREMLSPHLQNSPLLSGPFKVRAPDLGVSPRSPRSARGAQHTTKTSKAREIVNQSAKGNIVPPIVNPYSIPTSARQRNHSTSSADYRALLYNQRNRILTMNRQDFFKDLPYKYQNRANMTPYGMDMSVYRDLALQRSKQNRKEEEYEDMVATATTSRIKTQARKAEVANDKRFTRDYIINIILSVIELTERVTTLLCLFK